MKGIKEPPETTRGIRDSHQDIGLGAASAKSQLLKVPQCLPPEAHDTLLLAMASSTELNKRFIPHPNDLSLRSDGRGGIY